MKPKCSKLRAGGAPSESPSRSSPASSQTVSPFANASWKPSSSV